MNFQKHFKSCDRAASGKTTELMCAADRQTRYQRVFWKQALGKIASPAFRLHRYRSAHNRLLQMAWCKLDSSSAGTAISE